MAGIADAVMLADVTMEHYDRTMDVDLRGVLLGMKHGIRAMLEAGNGGAIVNWSSIGGLNASPFTSVYSAAKAGVIALTKAAAVEYGAQGHPRQRVCPGFIHTEIMGAHPEHMPGILEKAALEPRRPGRTRSPRSPRSSRPTARRSSPAPSSRSTAAGPRSSPERRHRDDAP